MKKLRVCYILLSVCILAFTLIYLNRSAIGKAVVSYIAKELEEGYKGKDFVCSWGDGTFQIGHYYDGNHLELHEGDSSNICPVLKGIAKYKVKKNKFYVAAEEGYAVCDDTNIIRVFVTVPDDEFINGYTGDGKGGMKPISRYIDDSHIVYLESFNEFSLEEQKLLKSLQN